MGFKNQARRPGEIERFKARYVAKGFEQDYGVDFFETWAPVGRYATLRALLSIFVVWDLEMKHIDIKCAFLNGVLHQDVYIVQPPMFHDGTRRVWKLKKAMCGLKQAAREWHKALVELLSEIGFDRCHIAGDTTEAELIAMSSTANELMWIKQLCTDLCITAKKPTLWGDNKSADLLSVNPISSDQSKHIRVRHLRVREDVEHDEMDVQ